MSDTTDALKGALLSAADDYANSVAADAVATQKAADQTAYAALQAKYDAYVAAHPDQPAPPPPPAPATGWGFNVFNGWNGYSQPAAAETSTQMLTRLKATFGTFGWCKAFYPGFLPATWTKGNQGEADPANPASHVIVCFKWTYGTIADGTHDAVITTYAKSVPAGKHVILTCNEVDNHGINTAYVADMDHLYDLISGLDLAATVEVWDCFMGWSLDPSSGPAWRDWWTNPAKRHGIVWDYYWNQSTIDKTGRTAVSWITATMQRLGMTRWVLGETGDRRPGTNKSTETNDTTRAASMTNRLGAVLAADPKPEAVLWFDVVGSTGDHRLLDADAASRAALSGFMRA